jgi:transcriptional regulator with XRE-family HTH domain
MITGDQIRAGRALLRVSQAKLAARAGVSIATLRRIEAGTKAPGGSLQVIACLQQALEAEGAEFIDRGVRCRHRRTPDERERLLRDLRDIAHRSAKFAAENPGGFLEDELYDESGLPA